MGKFLGLDIAAPFFPSVERDETPSDAVSLKRFVTTSGAFRWRWTFGMEPLTAQELAIVTAHQNQHGLQSGFDFVVPQLTVLVEDVATSATATGSSNSTTMNVVLSGGNELPTGHFVSAGGQLYQVTQGRTGSGAVQVYPPFGSAREWCFGLTANG